jgi:hypothetical protein
MRSRILYPAALAFTLALALLACVQDGDPGATDPDPIVLPPDPGAEGRKTVAGIDSDSDGVRDDFQIYAYENIADTTKRKGALRLGITMQAFLDNGATLTGALAAAVRMNRAIDCLYALDTAGFAATVDDVEGKIVNTDARLRAYIKAGSWVSAGGFTVSTVADNAAACREAP